MNAFSSPLTLFRRVAIAEAVTWALLITGMVLKYTGVTPVAVAVFGTIHGIVFIAYCLVSTFVAVDQRWSTKRYAVALACSIPPFATAVFDRVAEKQGALGTTFRLQSQDPVTLRDKLGAWLLGNPGQGAAVGAFAVVFLTGVALMVGPPG